MLTLICVARPTDHVEHLFMCFIGHLYMFLNKMFVQIFCPFLLHFFVFL